VPRQSAGLLLFRRRDDELEVLIVHPGGPFWAKKDLGAWSIPKGEVDGGEPWATAARELEEELGRPAPIEGWIDLGEVTQAGGKRVRGWAVEGDLDAEQISSNTFEIEWPPRSGRRATFPEIDRAMWCAPHEAVRRVVPAQAALVERLVAHLGEG
jgi:predicted NUDIX family NTP pyrophosphohydrolase